MTEITDIDMLQARVQELERDQDIQWKQLKDNVKQQYENIKPINLIKNAFSGLTDSIDNESDILKEGAALASGLIANAIMSGSKNKPMKRWVTLALFSAATYLITRYQDEIIAAGHNVMEFVAKKVDQFKANMERKRAEKEAEEEEEEDVHEGI
ncbi:MAG: hypothetical protein IPN60_11740 [Saprospiraceae bacterium]|nr:hypothetical protein [Candidatus Opimibacter skivensis]